MGLQGLWGSRNRSFGLSVKAELSRLQNLVVVGAGRSEEEAVVGVGKESRGCTSFGSIQCPLVSPDPRSPGLPVLSPQAFHSNSSLQETILVRDRGKERPRDGETGWRGSLLLPFPSSMGGTCSIFPSPVRSQHPPPPPQCDLLTYTLYREGPWTASQSRAGLSECQKR